MERIAADAGVGRAALYRRYKTVGVLTLAALLVAGGEQVPMRQSSDLAEDLEAYFTNMVKSLARNGAVGRALRILLARSQTDDVLAASFRDFLTQRREPVRIRLATAHHDLSDCRMEQALDQTFGPILYRLLIRNMEVDGAAIESCIATVLAGLREPRDKSLEAR